jgi:acyl carrier protein
MKVEMALEALSALVVRAAVEVAEREGVVVPSDLGLDTALFGKDGLFDSLGLVSLVLAVEEAIEDEHGAVVSLADERAMSQTRSPFRTIGSLVEYAGLLIAEPNADSR